MWRLWFALSVVLPFQQLGNQTSSSSASSRAQVGMAAYRVLPPTPPQLQETMFLFCAFLAVGFPATIFSPGGGAATGPVTCFV